jgi:hypothetical protein
MMRVGIFLFGAIAGGMTVFGVLGLVSLARPLHPALLVIAIALTVRAGWWHWRNRRGFTFDREGVQARRNLAGRGVVGTAYFGWILGTTVFTQMTTPLVQALAVVVAVLGWHFGLATGLGMGLARSYAPWRGAVASGRSSPALVLPRFARPTIGFRELGVASSALLACLVIVRFAT